MCPSDDAHLTLEFENHFVIQPSIIFSKNSDYSKNKIGELGSPVEKNFEYSSGTNNNFLSIEEIKKINKISGF